MIMFIKNLGFKAVYLLLLGAISVPSSAQYRDKTTMSKYTDTLRLAKKESFAGLSVLDSVVPNYDVFITGENHTYMKSNSALWVKTIKYLYEHAGVRNVVIEYGHASGWLINQYLQTGDTALYRVLKKYAFKEYSDSYKDLMEFNQSLPDSAKITLIGIDLERGVYSAVKVLSMQVPKTGKAHDSIELHIESLMGLSVYQDKEIFYSDNDEDEEVVMPSTFSGAEYSVSATLDLIIDNFNAHSNHYRNYLDSNYALFEKTIKGLEDVRRWKKLERLNTTHDYVYRERYMYNRFVEEYKARGGKYYGQFGRCHATKKVTDKNGCNWFHFKSFASRIKQSEHLGLQNKILTMGILYKTDDYSKDDWRSIQGHVDSIFKHMDNNRLKLYNLPLDTALQNFFKDDFDYVFLNTTKPNKNHPYMAYEAETYEDGTTGKLTYSYGFINFDMTALNALYTHVGASGFKNSFTVHAIEISSGTKDLPEFMSVSYFGWMKGVMTEIPGTANKSTQSKLSGFIMRSTSFYNALSMVDFIDVMGGFSLGYTRLALNINQDVPSGTPAINDGFIGETNIAKYSNPGITWGLAGLIDFNFGNVTLGGVLGFQRDWSNKHWRAKKILKDSPKTDLGGRYYSFRLGFNF